MGVLYYADLKVRGESCGGGEWRSNAGYCSDSLGRVRFRPSGLELPPKRSYSTHLLTVTLNLTLTLTLSLSHRQQPKKLQR